MMERRRNGISKAVYKMLSQRSHFGDIWSCDTPWNKPSAHSSCQLAAEKRDKRRRAGTATSCTLRHFEHLRKRDSSGWNPRHELLCIPAAGNTAKNARLQREDPRQERLCVPAADSAMEEKHSHRRRQCRERQWHHVVWLRRTSRRGSGRWRRARYVSRSLHRSRGLSRRAAVRCAGAQTGEALGHALYNTIVDNIGRRRRY